MVKGLVGNVALALVGLFGFYYLTDRGERTRSQRVKATPAAPPAGETL